MNFCPKCGTRVGPSGICNRCGVMTIAPQGSQLISSLRSILINEQDAERKQISRNRFKAQILGSIEDILEIKLDFPRFEKGDVVGYIKDLQVRPLGTVIDGGEEMSVKPIGPVDLEEGEFCEICEAETLIGYQLQLELLDNIVNGRLNEIEKIACDAVFEKIAYQNVSKQTLADKNDVKRKHSLDFSQIDVIESILGLREGEILLVIGPPGTGKTTVISKAAMEISEKGKRVLIASHTNRAVDTAIENIPVELCLRVGRPEKVLDHIRKYLLSYKVKTALGPELEQKERAIREGFASLKDLQFLRKEAATMEDWKKYHDVKEKISLVKKGLSSVYEARNEMLSRESKALISDAKIIGSTLIKASLPPLEYEKFDIVLIDEASQCTLTLALLGMIKAKSWVLIGDHKQLLPVLQTVPDKKKQEELSAFTSLLFKYDSRKKWLRRHYRSNSAIINFAAKYVYDQQIEPDPSCSNIRLNLVADWKQMPYLDPLRPVVFIDCLGEELDSPAPDYGSKFNPVEVAIMSKIVAKLRSMGLKSDEIGIITPYKAQKAKLLEQIKEDHPEIDTVDSFQGREKDVILVSLTGTSKHSLEFVSDSNRLNVALTRPRKKLIVVGNMSAIRMQLPSSNLLMNFCDYATGLRAVFHQ